MTHTIGKARREFFDDYAKELRRQRASGRRDDLDLGTPITPPQSGEASNMRDQIQGMMLGSAWLAHRRGDRFDAVKKGLRALSVQPSSLGAWKSVAALLLKPAPGPTPGSRSGS